ncbi:MAG: tellurite resistance TerB C-terminal domain-containing protein [Catonella sp.]|nr:tellurite resistance TerB C-terminal domain-containing protein [Catonella sp.]
MWITVLLSGFIDKEKYINLLRNAFELTDDPKHSELDFLTDTRQDKSKRFSEAYKDAPIDFSKVKSRRKRAELEKIKAGIKKSSDNLKNQSKEEKEKINIDFDSLQNIRSDAAVTMEKLLTEEQLDGDKPMPEMSLQEEESKQDAIDADMFFTGHEIYFLKALLNGKEYKKYLSSNHIKLSMLIDSINEKMMDTTGDTVIEFNGDEPELIVDYIEDIKEKL